MKPEMMKDEHKEMMMDDHKMMDMMEKKPELPKEKEPMYMGTFSKASHGVEGDIFLLDEKTIYIQGFSFDGEAPDVHFWSDGVAIPYYTR